MDTGVSMWQQCGAAASMTQAILLQRTAACRRPETSRTSDERTPTAMSIFPASDASPRDVIHLILTDARLLRDRSDNSEDDAA